MAHYQPAWSPDGTRIVYVNQTGAGTDLYVMNADGTDPVRLTADPANETEPAWSPDGSRIAFTSNRRGGGSSSIYLINADGSGLIGLALSAAQDATPAWSPDGSRIAFTRQVCDRPCVPQIHVMTANGTGVRPVGDGHSPAWSPDGRRIAYSVVTCDAYYYGICYGTLTGGIRILHADDDDQGPTVIDLYRGDHYGKVSWRR